MSVSSVWRARLRRLVTMTSGPARFGQRRPPEYSGISAVPSRSDVHIDELCRDYPYREVRICRCHATRPAPHKTERSLPAKKNQSFEKNLQRKWRKLSVLAQDPPGKFQVSTAPDPGASCRFFLGFFSGKGGSPVEPEMTKGGSMTAKLETVVRADEDVAFARATVSIIAKT